MAVKTFSLTEALFLRFHDAYQSQSLRVRSSRRFWPPVGAICLLMSVLELTGVWRLSPTVDLASMLLTFGSMLLIFPFFIPKAMNKVALKAFRKQPSLQEPVTVSWDAHQVEHVARTWSNRHAWSDFSGWAETSDGFMLFVAAGFLVIPREVLTDAEADDVRALLERNVKTVRA